MTWYILDATDIYIPSALDKRAVVAPDGDVIAITFGNLAIGISADDVASALISKLSEENNEGNHGILDTSGMTFSDDGI